MRILDQEAVAVLDVRELVDDRRHRPPSPRRLLIGVEAQEANHRVQVQIPSHGGTADS